MAESRLRLSGDHGTWITVAQKEFIEIVRDGRFAAATLIILVLLASALAVGSRHASAAHEERARLTVQTRAQWEDQPARNPHGAAHFGMYAVKPAGPLAIVDRGVEPYLGVAAYLEAHYRNPFRYRPSEETTELARLGELTAATVLQLILPLLICVLLYAVFAGEREQGTLRHLLSIGVSRGALLAGKAVGAVGALALVIVPASMLGALILVQAEAVVDAEARFALLLGGYLAYFAFFVFAALAVSALVRSSRVALTVLLVFWVWNGFVAPVLASNLAERLHPLPSAQVFWHGVHTDLEQGLDGHAPRSQRYDEFVARTLRKYGVGKVEELPINIAGLAFLESEAYSDRVYDKHYAELWRTLDKQANVHRLVSFGAPLLAVRSWSMGLAGTDLSYHRAFADAAERYRRLITRRMNEDLAYSSRSTDYFYRSSQKLWTQMPEFRFNAPSGSEVARAHALDFAAIAILAFAAFLGAILATRRITP